MNQCWPQETNLSRQINYFNVYTDRTIKIVASALTIGQSELAMVRADQAVQQMTCLNVDWQHLGGEPPNRFARETAKTVLYCVYMLGLEPDLVTASSDSGVGICFRKNGKYADVECFNSGEIASSFIDENRRVFTWEIKGQSNDIIQAIERIKRHLNA